MDDMIDLGRYVRAVTRRWPVVLALAIVGALAGFFISRVLSPVYEAGTTLLVTTPKLKADFDSRFRSTLELGLNTTLNRTLFNLIKNRELEAQVVQVMGNALTPEEQAPGALMERIVATQVGGDTSYFRIKARHSDPAMAQQLANTWASVYVAQVNELYGFPLEAEREIGTSLEAAKARLGEAEDRLEAFQRETGVGLVDNVQYPASFSRQSGLTDVRNLFGLYERYGAAGEALETKNLTLGSYLAARDAVNLLIGQAETLREEGNTAGRDLPLELLSAREVLAARGRLDTAVLAAQDISGVLHALRAETVSLEGIIAALQTDVRALQAKLAEKQRELIELVRERQLAEELYIILALKEQEIETRTQVQDSWLLVVSPAQLPREPVSPKVLVNTAVGGVLGSLLGVLAALLLALRSEAQQVA